MMKWIGDLAAGSCFNNLVIARFTCLTHYYPVYLVMARFTYLTKCYPVYLINISFELALSN